MAVIIGMSGDVKGKSFQIDREMLTLGRSKDNTIPLDNSTVSGHHCAIVFEGNRYILRDRESTNGTRLNSREISEAVLKPKDLIQVGSVEFLFDAEENSAVDTHSYAETQVEVAPGPASAPDSFSNISPFGARRKENRGLWFLLIALVGVLTLIGVVFFFFTLLTTG
ncbi:MAG: FHA domain-containing protein [Lentisphaerota bacterium]